MLKSKPEHRDMNSAQSAKGFSTVRLGVPEANHWDKLNICGDGHVVACCRLGLSLFRSS